MNHLVEQILRQKVGYEMWNDFTKAFSHKFTGTMYKRVELFVSELQIWVEWHDNAAQYRVQQMAFAAGAAGVTLGLFIGWLLWSG